MAIRKYGNEPAEVETKAEDNDAETLSNVRKAAQENRGGEPERNRDGDLPDIGSRA